MSEDFNTPPWPPDPQWKQTNCRYEPPFGRDDNVMFFWADPDALAHRPQPECDEFLPHKVSECGWFTGCGVAVEKEGM